MDYPHFSVNFVNFGIHKLSTLIKMWTHSCVKKKGARTLWLLRSLRGWVSWPSPSRSRARCRDYSWPLMVFTPPQKKNQINKLKVRKFSCALIQITKRNLLHVLPFYLSLSSKHDFHSGGSLCSTPTRQSQHTWGNCLVSSSQFSHYWE